MPWTREQVRAFVGGLSESTLARIERGTEAIPAVPLPGRGEAPLVIYDEEEVRAWWARRVAEAQAKRVGAAPAVARVRTGRGGLRLPVSARKAS